MNLANEQRIAFKANDNDIQFFFIHILYENSFFLQLLSIPVEQSKTEVVTDVLIPGISDIPFIEDEMTDSDG